MTLALLVPLVLPAPQVLKVRVALPEHPVLPDLLASPDQRVIPDRRASRVMWARRETRAIPDQKVPVGCRVPKVQPVLSDLKVTRAMRGQTRPFPDLSALLVLRVPPVLRVPLAPKVLWAIPDLPERPVRLVQRPLFRVPQVLLALPVQPGLPVP